MAKKKEDEVEYFRARCDNCRFSASPPAKVSLDVLQCRRRSPTVEKGFPYVNKLSVCGEHEVDLLNFHYIGSDRGGPLFQAITIEGGLES